MQLPGRLDRTTLGDILGALYRERATGTLELHETRFGAGPAVHRVHFDCGLILDVQSQLPVVRLGELLYREGLVDRAAVLEVGRRLTCKPGLRVGEVLVEAEFATAEIVDAGLRRQLRERLDGIFGVRSAQLRFRVATRRPRSSLPGQPLSPHEFLSGRPRARDLVTPGPSARSEFGAREPARPKAPPHRRSDPVRARALDTLGLTPGASPEQARQAFRRLASRYHPDRFPVASETDRDRARDRFVALSRAYHELLASG